MKTKSRTDVPVPQDETRLRHLPLVDLLVDTRTELFELATRAGLRVFSTMLEEDRTTICGPRYVHQPDRSVGRAGTVPSDVVLGGRKVTIQRPRVRGAEGEVPLPTFATMAHTDPLDRRGVEQMLVGVADAAVRAESRTAQRRHQESRHQQERGEPALRGEDAGAT
jgi:hypothetical protein